MFLSLLFLSAVLAGAVNPPAVPTVRRVEIEGNFRIPAVSVLRQVSAKTGSHLDPAGFRADLRKLHNLGIFEDLQVETRDAGQGRVDVIYKVQEYPLVSSFSIEGIDQGLEKDIRDYLQKEKRELYPSTPCNPSTVNKTAHAIRDFLRIHKHPNAQVHVLAEKRGNTVRVSMRVSPGPKLEIGSVKFKGNKSIHDHELIGQMKYAHPAFFVARWMGSARYIPEELDSDLQRIRIYYKSRGFAAAWVGPPRMVVSTTESKILRRKHQRITIEIPVVEGPRYRLDSLKVRGDAKAAAADVKRIAAALTAPRDYNYSLLEQTRQKIADALGHHGYALAKVQLEQASDPIDHTVSAIYRIDARDPVVIGRIDFKGNTRIPDKFLRRELKSREGEIFDTRKLDESVRRLNKSKLVKEVAREDVSLNMNDETQMLDITFHIKEKDLRGIYATGGTGGLGGGYLGILYSAFNMLHLGENFSLELDGGASQTNMLLNIVGTHFLGSGFTVALAVFNRYLDFNAASFVPGPEDLIGVLRRRSTGIALSGSYPLTMSLQAGLGFTVEKDSITDTATSDTTDSGRSWRSGLTPSLVFDTTKGTGAATRGFRFAYSQAFDGSLFLKSLDSVGESLQLSHYISDPFTHGRNSFAFRFNAAVVRPHAGGPLFLERRFYPGDETVRGFSRGSLSPWVAAPKGSDFSLQPAGADTLLGFSAEYRVPIRGPLSSAAFFDLGWTHLDSRHAAQFGSGAKLIEETNGLLRASLGGELRLQLPIVHQPARFIFSWNPLRLNTYFQKPSSVLRLVEPATTFRFGLGSLF